MHLVRVELADPAHLRAARRAVDREVAAARTALARELPRAQLAAGRPVRVSALLADLIAAALDAARRTDGDVDPTVGAALLRLRYASHRPWLPACGSGAGVLEKPAPGWREVRLDGQWLTVPPTILLDLGATAPARTAERCAALVLERYGTAARVEIDGDVASTLGPALGRSRGRSWTRRPAARCSGAGGR
ncbi:hypothetical protein Prum_083660 [Phytohabitans rumicis]|uniref:Uncharacterized protein n=1 Tax=Phytohabitans rumicis TaxID=1076125 RepID=A0A6V8LEL8_9ACTN|nr:hypothetical protein Prum_083660 [Phytohabitans rumicis]